ncbi:non-reducing end alpha-L-arabinofuranosidase family hydrolase [Alienimonas californiensis]|uniref:non-reducing end alpha-L-arabinofuranosidase n=1 Tax=Alienimonas californiensis TaxID=2527989 RepID=A0A517P538_9PLAN|nr:non-reducing end alpha-L-arabinofuranosidase family hydrolase [Alienimonas californiensis]QDT14502.1 Alpha-L-arabinofuranosidase C precursor [Alienimonas californiensis]
MSTRCFRLLAVLTVGASLGPAAALGAGEPPADTPFLAGDFHWTVSPPLLAVDQDRLPPSPGAPWVAVKDPSVVRHDGRWHLFCTLRKNKEGDGRIRIGYLSFENWEDAAAADWALLDLTPDYHGAPQIFYYEPQRKWYLIYQAVDPSRGLKYGPCYSTCDRVDDPAGWTKPEPLYVVPEGMKAGLDHWVICDEAKAHHFFTTNDGRMWRAETALANFPDRGWSRPEVALQADIFEASHTYRLKGTGKYFTIVEAQGDGRRYFKAYTADRLDGEWTGVADARDRPMVSPQNVTNRADSWATSYSHGELIRTGVDQRLEVDAATTRILFQGVDDAGYDGSKNYGQIPWRLGLLGLAP